MRFAVCAAILLRCAVAHAGPIEVLNSIGPWRIGVLHNRMDDLDTDIVSNVGDEYHTLTFAFRCLNGNYDSVIFKRDGQKLFDRNRTYKIEWRIDKDTKHEATATGLVDAGVKMDDPIKFKDLIGRHELLIRVYALDNAFDAIIPLTDAELALQPMMKKCVSQ